MKIKLGQILLSVLFAILISCNGKKEPEFNLLTLNINNEIEFLKRENVSKIQLEYSLDSLLKLNDRSYLMLDIADESSYGEFYELRETLQKYRENLLISLKDNKDQINYYTISAEPESKELKRFSELQTIEIGRVESGNFIINTDSTIIDTELQSSLLKESKSLLLEQVENNNEDSVLMFWINVHNYTTYKEFKLLGESLNMVIAELKGENAEIITRIIELRKKDDNIR
jgi:hypothetical protein